MNEEIMLEWHELSDYLRIAEALGHVARVLVEFKRKGPNVPVLHIESLDGAFKCELKMLKVKTVIWYKISRTVDGEINYIDWRISYK